MSGGRWFPGAGLKADAGPPASGRHQVRQAMPTLCTHVDADKRHDRTRQIRCALRYRAKARPPLGNVLDAQRCKNARGHHGQCQADAEAHDQRRPQSKPLDLQTQQQHSDGCRTGNEATGQAEHHDLRRGDGLIGKTLLNVRFVCSRVAVSMFLRVVVVLTVTMLMRMMVVMGM